MLGEVATAVSEINAVDRDDLYKRLLRAAKKRTVEADIKLDDRGRPVAVLLEAGFERGLRQGLEGELVEGDAVIGRIEVVGVYSGGSRARIVGGLTRSISLDTRARIFLPPAR